MIELRALGTAEIHTGSAILTPSQGIVFATTLYLVLERGKRVSRAMLASWLWPKAGDKTRAHRLRQTVLQLKKLGVQITADRNGVEISKQNCYSDVDAVVDKISEVVADNVNLEFLPGYSPRMSENLRDWVDSKRAEAHAAITRALIRALESARRRGDWELVERVGAQCLRLDRYNETAVLARAESMAMRGGKQSAVAMLDSYLAEVGGSESDLRLPATLLRKRVIERIPDQPKHRDPHPLFVGREGEIEFLTQRFELARTGHGGGIRILGEPGIGKSKLCNELARFAELQGAHVRGASCRRTYVHRPLSLFVELVPLLRELPGALGCDPETFTTLRRLTEFEKPLGNSFSSQDSEVLFENVKNALFDLFSSVEEERTLVIVIDDAQWLDAASEKVLLTMLEWSEARRLLFLLNARSCTSLLTASAIETVEVGPLTSGASRTLLESMALSDTSESVATLIGWCLGVAEGNPFFLQELAHHCVETGERYDAPPSVARILDERVSRLTADALQVLQAAAVLGDHATVERIEDVLEFQSHRFLSAIEELSRASMLRTASEGVVAAVTHLQPRHDLLSSAALRRLAALSLAFLHRRSADVIEAEFAENTMPTALLWACASHRDCAGDREKALTVSLACAEQLLDVGLAGESVAAFEKSLNYCETDEQRLCALPRLAFAAQLNGEWTKVKQVLKSCIRIAAKVDPTATSHNDFELTLFATRLQSDLDFEPLLTDLMPCINSPDAAPSHRVKSAIIALKLATDFGPENVLDSIFETVEPFLNRADVDEAAGLELQIIYRTTRRKEIVPLEYLNSFAEAARRTGGELAYSSALLTATAACRISARYEDGLHFLATAYEHAMSNKRMSLFPRLHLAELRIHLAAERYESMEVVLPRFTDCAIPADDAFSRSDLQAYRTRVAIHRGDVLAASKAFTEIGPLLPTFSPRRRAHSLALNVHIKLLRRAPRTEIEPIVAQLEQDYLRVRGLGGQDFEVHALYLGLFRIGEGRRALELLSEYVQFHRRSHWKLPDSIRTVLAQNGQTEPIEMASAFELDQRQQAIAAT